MAAFTRTSRKAHITCWQMSAPCQGRIRRRRHCTFLKECGVASVPGSAFYHEGGQDLVRFCFAKKEDVLRLACVRLSPIVTLRRRPFPFPSPDG